MSVLEHPFTFAVGVGAANGLLAKVRGKSIDLPTAAALAGILGIGEAVIAAFEKPEPGKEHRSPTSVALLSVAGVAVGLAPFVSMGAEHQDHAVPVASTGDAETPEEKPT